MIARENQPFQQEDPVSDREEDSRTNDLTAPITRRDALKVAGAAAGLAMFYPTLGASAANRALRGATAASKQLAFGHPHPSGAFYAVVEAGAKHQASALGYELLQSRANGQLDKQISEVQTWIAEKVTAMTILALDVKSMGPLLKQAHGAGIPFVSYAQVVPGSDGFVLFDDAAAATKVGMAAASWIKKIGGPGKAKVAFMGDYTIQNVIVRLNNAQKALKAAIPDVNIVFRGKGLLAPEAFATTQTLLQQHPDLNVIICGADDGAIGAARAFVTAGKDVSNVWIAGYDGSQPAMEQAVSGTSPLRLVAALPLYDIGRQVVQVPDNVINKRGNTNYKAPYVMVSTANKAAGVALINKFKQVSHK